MVRPGLVVAMCCCLNIFFPALEDGRVGQIFAFLDRYQPSRHHRVAVADLGLVQAYTLSVLADCQSNILWTWGVEENLNLS